jgi:dephospho-CoA kinase
MPSYTIGLTGGIGCGKSTIAARFAELGATVVDADAASHALTRRGAAGWLAIRDGLGRHFLRDDGELDRARLRKAVFADPVLKARLEALLHPLIRDEMDRQAAASGAPYVLLMIPLLLEGRDPRRRCARILVVDCREETQIRRVGARSGLAAAEVRAIMATQVGRPLRLAAADDVIDNDGAPERALQAVARLDRLYRALSGSK